MDDYLTKPIQQKELAEMIARWTRGGESPASPSESGPGGNGRLIFDREALLRQIDSNEDLLRDLLTTFLEDTPQRLHSLEEAISRKDAPGVRYQGHALKGTCATMRALSLQEVSRRMEQAGERGDFAAAQEILVDLQRHFSDFQRVAGKEDPSPGVPAS